MNHHKTLERANVRTFQAENASRFTFRYGFLSRCLLLALPFGQVMQPQVRAEQPRQQDPFRVEQREYQGWKDAVWLSNGKVEAIVVPSIGRVMQFRALGDEGVLWENPAFFGKAVDPKAKDWGNFGGDKPWPAPQADWPKVTGRGWPPPIGFDASSWEVTTGGGTVELRSPVDPHYGVKVTRSIRLKPDAMVMDIATRYDKINGEPCEIAVWVVTQLKHPESMWFPIPKVLNSKKDTTFSPRIRRRCYRSTKGTYDGSGIRCDRPRLGAMDRS